MFNKINVRKMNKKYKFLYLIPQINIFKKTNKNDSIIMFDKAEILCKIEEIKE